jgi:hypothetical protein
VPGEPRGQHVERRTLTCVDASPSGLFHVGECISSSAVDRTVSMSPGRTSAYDTQSPVKGQHFHPAPKALVKRSIKT